MALSDLQLLDSLGRMPFIDSAELSRVLGEPHATMHRTLTGLLAHGIAGRVNHGTAHLPSSQRYHLTANGIREAARILGKARSAMVLTARGAEQQAQGVNNTLSYINIALALGLVGRPFSGYGCLTADRAGARPEV